jgi:hypothetical protein
MPTTAVQADDRELAHMLEDGETYLLWPMFGQDLTPSKDAEALPEIFATA